MNLCTNVVLGTQVILFSNNQHLPLKRMKVKGILPLHIGNHEREEIYKVRNN